MPPTPKKLGGHIALGLSVRPFAHHTFVTSHIFGTMYVRISKFHICIAYEKLADLYFFFCSELHGGVMPLFRLGILANEILVSKISMEPLEIGS